MSKTSAFWLMKTEPSVYSIDDLIRDKSTPWEGVRNYQARNFMRDQFAEGDMVLFYHSNAKPSGVAGVARVCKEAYPDSSSWNEHSPYFDPRSSEENPRWFRVDVEFVEKFDQVLSLERLKKDAELENMLVIRSGQRLSIQPVSKADFKRVLKLAGSGLKF